MLRSFAIAGGAAAFLTGCSAATASPADPWNDAHCFALAKGFSGVAHQGRPSSDEEQALATIADWYAPRLDAGMGVEGRIAALAEIAPLVAWADGDRRAARDAFRACIERAVNDGAFASFSAKHARR